MYLDLAFNFYGVQYVQFGARKCNFNFNYARKYCV